MTNKLLENLRVFLLDIIEQHEDQQTGWVSERVTQHEHRQARQLFDALNEIYGASTEPGHAAETWWVRITQRSGSNMDTKLYEDLQIFLIQARTVFFALGMGQGKDPTYTPEELIESLLHPRHDNESMARTAMTLYDRIARAHQKED